MKGIHIILEKSLPEYYEFVFEHFMRWCMSWSTTHFLDKEDTLDRHRREIMETKNDLQKLLANKAISQWYIIQYESKEQLFLDDYFEIQKRKVKSHLFEPLTLKEKLDLYERCVCLIDVYPKPLFEAARKLSIDNDTTAN